MGGRVLSLKQQRMLNQVKQLQIRQTSLSWYARAMIKTKLLNAVLEHLCEQYGARLKSHDTLI